MSASAISIAIINLAEGKERHMEKVKMPKREGSPKWESKKWEIEQSPNDSRNDRIPKPLSPMRRFRLTPERLTGPVDFAKKACAIEAKNDRRLESSGITPAQYRWLIDKQKGCCACCGEKHGDLLEPDYDSIVSKVSGLVDWGCLARLRNARKKIKAGLPWKPARPDATTAKVEEYLKRKPPIIPLIS